MGIKCGIVGLPNVGKSTLFNALTASEIPAENYPFCTIDPNVGVVNVPDPRLDALAAIVSPDKILPTVIEFVDIAGLVKGASKGEGLGNQFLAHIRETHAIAHLVRCFENDDITHVAGRIDPLDDIDTIETELLLADLESVQKSLDKAERNAKTNEKAAIARRDVLRKVCTALEAGRPARSIDASDAEQPILKELNLITAKPVVYIANVAEDSLRDNPLVARVESLAAGRSVGQAQLHGEGFSGPDHLDVAGRGFGARLRRIDGVFIAVNDVVVDAVFDVRRVIVGAVKPAIVGFIFRAEYFRRAFTVEPTIAVVVVRQLDGGDLGALVTAQPGPPFVQAP